MTARIANWSSLSAGDVDEGSLAPLPVSRGRVFQIGKDGVGYLLRHGLGGVGHHKFKAQVCGGEAFGADAWFLPLVARFPQAALVIEVARVGEPERRACWDLLAEMVH